MCCRNDFVLGDFGRGWDRDGRDNRGDRNNRGNRYICECREVDDRRFNSYHRCDCRQCRQRRRRELVCRCREI